MKTVLSRIILPVVFLCVFSIVPASAVSFGSYGAEGGSGQAPSAGCTSPQQSSAASGQQNSAVQALDLPGYEKERLADSVRLMQLTGLQAKLALDELAALEGRSVSAAEMKARLVYAEESLEALEKASERLEDSVEIVRMAYGERSEGSSRLAFLLDFFCATPASAYSGFSGSAEVDGMIANEVQSIGRGMKKTFDGMLNTLSGAAKQVGNFASKVKSAVSSGIGKVTGAVATAHHKIGKVVGQKNWATIMAGTKMVATITVGTAGLIVAAPATTAGAVGAVVVWTATNVGAAASFANDMSQISGNGNAGAGHLDNALTRVNQGTAVIGLVTSGNGCEVLVNVIGVSGNEIIGTTPAGQMSPEDLADYLDAADRKDFLKHFGACKSYHQPSRSGGNDGGGGEGGGCGCGH